MIPERVRLATLERLRDRVDRLVKALDMELPGFIIAGECELVGKMAVLIAPWDIAQHQANLHEREARVAAGVCADLECDRDSCLAAATLGHGLDDYCSEHAHKIQADRTAGRHHQPAVTNQEPDDEPS